MAATPTPNGTRFHGRVPLLTPQRRAISAEPPTSRRSLHTPLDRGGDPRDLLNTIRRGTPGRSNAPTPHAKAARRALDQRRNAMFTPGKNRRRSLQAQRETPLDILRNLGRALAPKSRPILTSSSSPDKPSPPVKPSQSLPEFEDDEFPIDRPRLSLPLDDDDSSDLHPYKSSMLEEGNYTVQSVELPRRAVSEQPSRMSLGVFGSEGGSDLMLNDATEGLGAPSDFFPGFLEDVDVRDGPGDFVYDRSEAEPARWMSAEGRESDFNLEMPAGLDEHSTFVMSDPAVEPRATPPIAQDSVMDADGDQTGEVVDEGGAISDDGGVSDDDHMFQHYDSFADYGAPGGDGDENDDDGEDDGGGDDGHMTGVAGAEMMLDDDSPQTQGQSIEGGELGTTKRKRHRVSRHGIEFPPLPPAFVKRVAQTALQSSGLSNSRISRDTLEVLSQASEWFFEQLGDDLGAYARHAKRKTIEDSDIITLMRRQRQIGGDSTIFSTAQRHLPRELLQELRMPPPRPTKQPRIKRKRQEEREEDVREMA